jgi:hypothetical protein
MRLQAEGSSAGSAAQGRRVRGPSHPDSLGITPAACGPPGRLRPETRGCRVAAGQIAGVMPGEGEEVREEERSACEAGVGAGKVIPATRVIHQTLGHVGPG